MSILRINVDNSAERWESKDGIYVHYSAHLAEMEKVRESVRRLVGEWEEKSKALKISDAPHTAQGFDMCIRDLTAFLAENKEFESK